MNLSKVNFVQAIGAVIAIILYLVGPVVGITLLPVGIKGTMAMRIDFLFVLPIILMGLTLLISIVPVGKITSIAGLVTGIATLIIGLCGGDILVGFVKRMGTLAEASTQIPVLSSLGVAVDALGMLLFIGWGALAAAILMIVAALAGLLLMSFQNQTGGGTSIQNYSSHSSSGMNYSSRGNSSTNRSTNIYRR